MNKPKLLLSILLLFYGYTQVNAQSGTVISGGDASGSGGTVSYSIGQIDYISFSGSGGNTNEGLQQPYEIFTVGIEDPSISLQLSLYPNPTTNSVFLTVEKNDLTDLSYQLFDMNGKQIGTYKILDKTTEVNMIYFSSGSYFLKVFNSNQSIQTFKIIKK